MVSGFFKGNLYRCRVCKCHFRVKESNANLVRLALVAGAALVVGLGFVLVPEVLRGIAQSSHNAGQQPPPLIPVQTDDVLAERAATLYEEAKAYHEQLPALIENYLQAAKQFEDSVSKATSETPDKATADARREAIRLKVEAALDRRHSQTAFIMTDFRRRLSSVLSQGAARIKACEKNRTDKKCDAFASRYTVLQEEAQLVVADIERAEQAYAQTLREIQRPATH